MTTKTKAEQEIAVELGVTQTEVGTLQIQCIAVPGLAERISSAQSSAAKQPSQRWNVEFQIRKAAQKDRTNTASLPPQTRLALEQIEQIFGPKSKSVDPNAVKNLRNFLEKTFGKARSEWETPILRALFEALWQGGKIPQAKRSARTCLAESGRLLYAPRLRL